MCNAAHFQISPHNSVGRTDLRHLPVCSIDPPGCKDIDDALHVLALDDGNFEVQGGTVEPSFRTVAM